MVVRHLRRNERNPDLILEEFDHLWAVRQIRLDEGFIVVVAKLLLQITATVIEIVADAGPSCERVSGNPKISSGDGGGAAEHRRLLHKEYVKASPATGNRCGQSCCSRTNYKHVAYMVAPVFRLISHVLAQRN